MAIDYCAYCTYMDKDDENHGKFRCEKDDKYYSADSKPCSNNCPRFRYDMHIGDDLLKKSHDYKLKEESEYKSVGCFITTIVVNVLGLDDNCEVLMVLRKFRNEVLQKDKKYLELLMKYDIIGPKIANKINMDENKEEVAADLYFDYLVPCVDALKAGDQEEAIRRYTDMVDCLTDKYLIQDTLEIANYQTYNQSEGGHGRLALS